MSHPRRICLLLMFALSHSLLSVFGAGEAVVGRFDAEIAALLAADRTNPPPANPVVFAGSSTFRMWKSLAADMSGLPVVNRGFGGSTMSDLNHYASQIVLPLKPRVVVVYEGDNDIAGGKSPEAVLKDFDSFAQMLEQALPQTRLVVVSVKPSPSRRAQLERQHQLNELLRALCRQGARRTYVDLTSRMLDSKGEPLEGLFLADRLHMNLEGYRIWSEEIRKALDSILR